MGPRVAHAGRVLLLPCASVHALVEPSLTCAAPSSARVHQGAHLPARTVTTRGSAVSYKQAKRLVMIVMGSFMLELPSLGMRHLSGRSRPP